MRRTTEQRRRRERFLGQRCSATEQSTSFERLLWLPMPSQNTWTHASCICMPATMAYLPYNYPEACELLKHVSSRHLAHNFLEHI